MTIPDNRIRHLLLIVLVSLALPAIPVPAGVNVWTTNGPEGADIRALAIDPSSPATVYSASDYGVFKSTDGGGSWTGINAGLSGHVFDLAIDRSAPATVYAGTYHGGVFKSTNGGGSWSAINTGLTSLVVRALAIDPSAPATLYAGTVDGWGVFKSTNGGVSWTAVHTGLFGPQVIDLAVDPTNPNSVYAGTNNGVFKSTNGGGAWTAINLGLPVFAFVSALAIDPSTPAVLYAGTGSGIFKSTDAGGSWAFLSSGSLHVNALAIDPTRPSTVYAGTYRGVFKSVDAGESWTPTNSGLTTPSVQALAIDPSATATLYVGTSGSGGVFKSTNRGGSWNPINRGLPAPSVDAMVIDPSRPGVLYAGAGDGSSDSGGGRSGFFKSINGAATWTYPSAAFDYVRINSLAIDPSAPATVYAGIFSWEDANSILKSTDGGVNWTTSLPNVSVLALAIDPSTQATLYAGTIFSGVLKSTDRGESWTPLDTGLTDSSVQALAIDPAAPSTIYAGTSDHVWASGGVIKSDDGGGTWTAMNTGLANSPVLALAIDPATPATLYAGTRRAGVFKSTNGGESWIAVNTGLTHSSVFALAIDPSAPATLYAGTSGGGVLKSANGGASWTAMNAGLANPFVNALAIDPSTPSRLYAGTDAGVYEYLTADGPCVPDVTTLCLNGGRFRVTTQWSTLAGQSGAGQAVPLTEDTGYFTFFDPANVEVLVKVLNGCGFNSRFWTFAGGLTDVHVVMTVFDSQTGAVKTYTNPQSTAFQPIQDTDAFLCSSGAGDFSNRGAATGIKETAVSTTLPVSPSSSNVSEVCVANATTLCLNGSRYRVQAQWFTPDGTSGAGQVIPLTSDTGAFWFFSANNVEMVIKVLNGCSFSSRYWTFAAGLTDVAVMLTVTDTQTGTVRTYTNPQGTPFGPIQDTNAFATCP